MLLTKTIEATIPALYTQEKVTDPTVRVKFFTPWSNWTWYVLEAEREQDDVRFFGLVAGHEVELGYFSLAELESVTGPGGLKIERDLYFKPTPLSAIQAYENERRF